MDGGIGIIEMLKKTNILALVGGGKSPKYPPNKIIIWDDHQGKIISKFRFNENVINVRLRNDRIISILENKLYIFDLNTLETISILDTFENPTGIIGISNGLDYRLLIAVPYKSQGQLYLGNCFSQELKELYTIQAHDSKIACISINREGSLLATASDKGTIIRIFLTMNGEKISEFRRGTKSVSMYCISFDPNDKFIGCTSDAGTLHIFSIFGIMKLLNENNNKNNKFDEEPKNTKSFLGKIGGLLKIKNSYLNSDRFFAKYKIQENNSLLAFGNDNTFVVIDKNGKYYKVAYDPIKGGDCCKIEEKNIFNDV